MAIPFPKRSTFEDRLLGVLFDLMLACPLLRNHAAHGTVGFGINHEMTDFVSGRRKNLDLVICTPRSDPTARQEVTFGDLIGRYDIQLAGPELLAYESMIHRMSGRYDTRFHNR